MFSAPHTYSEWSSLLSDFKEKKDDSEVIVAMKEGTIEWQMGVAERFSRKLIDAVNTRMNNATDQFQTDMNRANGQEANIVNALIKLRKEMALLADAIDLPALPEKDRQKYKSLVIEQAHSIQKSLEDSAKRDKSGKLSSIVRNHKVDII